jgi:23S rRNA pseudouridine955/2504/2580 synthase/23S rRNA pseudouridine1911/1915/1917 synthase
LSYHASKISDEKVLWDIELHTGKFHQIRAQLSYLHCPIIGDALYGSTVPYRQDAIALCASKLIFYHPMDNHEISIAVPGLI